MDRRIAYVTVKGIDFVVFQRTFFQNAPPFFLSTERKVHV